MRTIGLLISILLLAMSCGSSSSKKWDGTWSTTEGKSLLMMSRLHILRNGSILTMESYILIMPQIKQQ